MTALSRIAANRAIGQAMTEIIHTEPQMAPADAAYLLLREAALVLGMHRGQVAATSALDALSDELLGAP